MFLDALPPIPTYLEAWAVRDGCSPTQSPSVSNPTTHKKWECSSDDTRAVVEGYMIDGLGHSWPNTNGGIAPFDATPHVIVPFFDAHPFK
jgi:poly(3-hydroxybutyrate) depolymerase